MKYPEILSIAPAPGEFSYDNHYTRLYALGIGAGAEERDLRFVYEKELQALPTMGVMMATAAGDFITHGGIDYRMIVHGEQRIAIHNPLPVKARMRSQARCLSVIDKGDKGALLNVECNVWDADSDVHHVTSTMTFFCRGDGGFGGPSDGDLVLPPVPDRPHDLECALPTLKQQAALYRLLGDVNPLHIDPEQARAVGFPGPILHGLCTYGIACRAVIRACCDDDPAKIAQFDVRFSSPVYPGETLVTRIWRDGNDLSFACSVAQRDATVIRNGYCKLRS